LPLYFYLKLAYTITMDTDDLIAHARARFDHVAAKRVLKEKYEARMLFAYAGGMWRAGPDLLVLLKSCPDESAVLLDLYENPVRVDVPEFELAVQQRWQEQMNGWLAEYDELRKQR
jgi:hypothetical protein